MTRIVETRSGLDVVLDEWYEAKGYSWRLRKVEESFATARGLLETEDTEWPTVGKKREEWQDLIVRRTHPKFMFEKVLFVVTP